jgi:hypothetical protein
LREKEQRSQSKNDQHEYCDSSGTFHLKTPPILAESDCGLHEITSVQHRIQEESCARHARVS